MARRATGGIRIVTQSTGRIAYYARFRAKGKRWELLLGTDAEGWSEQRARNELDQILDRVARGVWRPPAASKAQRPAADPTFHEFASSWYRRHVPALAVRTAEDYEWRLSVHLLPFFATYQLSEIDTAAVGAYRESKVQERQELRRSGGRGGLSNDSINMTVALLAQILDEAAERRLPVQVPNPAAARRRRLKSQRARRSFLEPDQASALLEAARLLDEDGMRWSTVLEIRASSESNMALARRFGVSDSRISQIRRGVVWRTPTSRPVRRPLIAVMLLAGPRISEVCALNVGDVDLPNRRLLIADAKTDAGRRWVSLSDLLVTELEAQLELVGGTGPKAPLFPNHRGARYTENGVRRSVVGAVVEKARELLPSMPARVTPHTLRRTYISLLLAGGADVPWVMAQVGHADPKVTLQIYAQVIQSRQRDYGARVDEMVSGATPIGGPIGGNVDKASLSTSERDSDRMSVSPATAGDT